MDIHEQVASEAEKAALELGKTAVTATRGVAQTAVSVGSGVISLLDLLIKYIKNEHINIEAGEQTLEKMKTLIKDGDYLSNLKIADKNIEFFKKAMKNEDMAYVVLDENIDTYKTVLFMHSDSKKMENIINLHRAKSGLTHEVEPDTFIRHCKAEDIGIVRNISDTEFELFRDKTKETELVYSFYEKNGKITLLYEPTDKDLVQSTLDEIALDMSGKYADYITENLIFNRSANREFENAIAGRGEFYAVNLKDSGNYITVTDAGLSYYKNDSIVSSIVRSDRYFADKARDTFRGLQNAVSLSKYEFERPDEERHLIIESRRRIYSDEITKNIEKSRDRLRNVIRKMSLDDENDNPSQVFDDAVSYSNYAGYEEMSDIDREEMKEQFKKFYNKRKTYEYKEVTAKNRSLDNIIRNAEKQKDSQNSQEIHREEIHHEYESERSL